MEKRSAILPDRPLPCRPICVANTGFALQNTYMHAPETLRLATWNIKHGAKADRYLGHPKAMAEACAALEADILALQEVDKGVARSGFRDLARLAAREAGMQEPIFRKTLDYRIGQYGNALLLGSDVTIIGEPDVEPLGGGYRFKRMVGKRFVHGRTKEPRNAIFATVHTRERTLTVAATHLSTERGLRKKQLHTVVDRLDWASGAVALLGDLNMQRREAQAVLGGSLQLPDTSPKTYPAPQPARSIDHIAVRGLIIHHVEAREMPVSDHRALIMDVEFY